MSKWFARLCYDNEPDGNWEVAIWVNHGDDCYYQEQGYYDHQADAERVAEWLNDIGDTGPEYFDAARQADINYCDAMEAAGLKYI